jgi:hypothetical protein
MLDVCAMYTQSMHAVHTKCAQVSTKYAQCMHNVCAMYAQSRSLMVHDK